MYQWLIFRVRRGRVRYKFHPEYDKLDFRIRYTNKRLVIENATLYFFLFFSNDEKFASGLILHQSTYVAPYSRPKARSRELNLRRHIYFKHAISFVLNVSWRNLVSNDTHGTKEEGVTMAGNAFHNVLWPISYLKKNTYIYMKN